MYDQLAAPPVEKSEKVRTTRINVRTLESALGLKESYHKRVPDGIMYTYEHCPNDSSHIRTFSIVEKDDGGATCQCFHNSCGGNKDFMSDLLKGHSECVEKLDGTAAPTDIDIPDGRDEGEEGGTIAVALNAVQLGCTVFRDNRGEVYVTIHGKHDETYEIHAEAFKSWITTVIWQSVKKSFGRDSITTLLRLLAHSVKNEDPVYLDTRTNITRGANGITLWYDLVNRSWQVVKTVAHPDGRGWEVTDKAPALFRRHKSQKSQMTPAPFADGDINLIDRYVRVKRPSIEDLYADLQTEGKNKVEIMAMAKDAADQYMADVKLLLKVFDVFQYIPSNELNMMDRPPLIYCGDHGATKSSACEVKKRLIDPSTPQKLTMADDPDRMQLQLESNYCVVYDNLGNLKRWQSDMICRAATGDGAQKRVLFTDSELVTYEYTRTVIINGLEALATMPDIVDRSITIELETVPPEERINKEEFWPMFEKDLPRILAGIFTTLSKAMYIYPTLKLDEYERMTGFYKWGIAIATAIDPANGAHRFKAIYKQFIREQNEVVISNNPVAEAVILMMTSRGDGDYSEYAKTLLADLEAQLPGMGFDKFRDKNGNEVQKKTRVLA